MSPVSVVQRAMNQPIALDAKSLHERARSRGYSEYPALCPFAARPESLAERSRAEKRSDRTHVWNALCNLGQNNLDGTAENLVRT
jgi:hypothetical protein